jgi:cytochrome P450
MVTRHSDVLEALSDPSLQLWRARLDLVWPPRAALGEVPDDPWPVISEPLLFGTLPRARRPARTIATRAMTTKRVRMLEPELRALASRLVDQFAQDGHCELMEDFCRPFIVRVFANLLLGLPEDLMAAATSAFDAPNRVFFDAIGLIPMPMDEQVALARDMAGFREQVLEVIDQRRRSPRNDLISDLLHTDRDVPPEDVLNTIAQMFRGFDQPYFMLGNIAELLLSEPSRWTALAEDPTGIPAAVDEGFRLRPTLPMLQPRVAQRDTVIGGRAVAKGSFVGIYIGPANRDPSVFSEPDRYLPARQTTPQHVTFSRGAHNCIGVRLAYAQTIIVFEELISRLRDAHLTEAERPPRVGGIFHGPDRLAISWATRGAR